MTEKLYELKLTRIEINHIFHLLFSNEEEGSYLGYKEQYWNRHERIVKKIHNLLKEGELMKSSGWMLTDAVNFVTCPKCCSPPGKNCLTPKGRAVAYVHWERSAALRKLPDFDDRNYWR